MNIFENYFVVKNCIKMFVQVAKSWKFNTRFSISLTYNNYERSWALEN